MYTYLLDGALAFLCCYRHVGSAHTHFSTLGGMVVQPCSHFQKCSRPERSLVEAGSRGYSRLNGCGRRSLRARGVRDWRLTLLHESLSSLSVPLSARRGCGSVEDAKLVGELVDVAGLNGKVLFEQLAAFQDRLGKALSRMLGLDAV